MRKNAVIRFFQDVLTSGTFDAYPFQTRRIFITLNGLLIPTAAILAGFGAYRLAHGNVFVGVADTSAAVFMAAAVTAMRIFRTYAFSAVLSCIVAAVLFSLLYLHGVAGHAGAMWIFFYPWLTMAVLGIRWGTLLPVLLIAANYAVARYFPQVPFYRAGYDREFAFIHMLSFMVFVLLSFINTYIYLRVQGMLTDSEHAVRARNAALAASNRNLKDFIRVGSHHLQEPLRNVVSYVQLLQERCAGRLGEQAEEYIGFAVEGATWMKHLIADLIAYATYGNEDSTLTTVDCLACLAEAESNLEILIKRTAAVVDHGDLPRIRGDHRDLVRLFQDLIGNAAKFHGEDPPRVMISACLFSQSAISVPAQVLESGAAGMWLFSVRDNGIGIEPAYRDKIFGVFEKLHSRSRYFGTGIGLAICRRIVERHGGVIWADSSPGGGATLYFTLPGERAARTVCTMEGENGNGKTDRYSTRRG